MTMPEAFPARYARHLSDEFDKFPAWRTRKQVVTGGPTAMCWSKLGWAFRDGPLQNGLNGSESWVVGFSNDRQHLKP